MSSWAPITRSTWPSTTRSAISRRQALMRRPPRRSPAAMRRSCWGCEEPSVARMERSVIRERPREMRFRSRITLRCASLHPGYGAERAELPVQKIQHGGLGQHGFRDAVARRVRALLVGGLGRLQVGAEVARALDDFSADVEPRRLEGA